MSPRPKRSRHIVQPPILRGFRPFGSSAGRKDFIVLSYDEYEAIRLADYKNLSQVQASVTMKVSRPTFTRIYDSALKKIARAFVEMRPLLIEGGKVSFQDNWFQCDNCGERYRVRKGGRDAKICPVCKSEKTFDLAGGEILLHTGNGKSHRKHPSGEGFLVCTNCKIKIKHHADVHPNLAFCPDCGISMKKHRKTRKSRSQ